MKVVSFRKTLTNQVVTLASILVVTLYVGGGLIGDYWIPLIPMLVGGLYSLFSNLFTVEKMPCISWEAESEFFTWNKGDVFFNMSEYIHYNKIKGVALFGSTLAILLDTDESLHIELESCDVKQASEFYEFLNDRINNVSLL